MTSAFSDDFYRVLNDLEEEGINWTSTVHDDDPRVIFLREYVSNMEQSAKQKRYTKKIAELKHLIYDRKISKRDIASMLHVTVSQLSGDMKRYGMDKDYVAFRKKLKQLYYYQPSQQIVKVFRNKTECKTMLKIGDKLLNNFLNSDTPRNGMLLWDYEHWTKYREGIHEKIRSI